MRLKDGTDRTKGFMDRGPHLSIFYRIVDDIAHWKHFLVCQDRSVIDQLMKFLQDNKKCRKDKL